MKMEAVLAAKGSRVVTLGPAAPVQDAIAVMAANNIGAVVAVDGRGLPTGVVSERDVVRALASGDDLARLTVGDLMTSPIFVAGPDDDVESVLRTMTTRRFRHVPVVEHGKLCGIITIGDLVKARLLDAEGAVATLEAQLMNA